jgi:hypothetical protein
MARIAAGKAIEAQDIVRNMILTDGKIVFKAVKVIPMNLTGILIATDKGVIIEPTYTHVQIVTARGNVLNAPITQSFVPLIKVSL